MYNKTAERGIRRRGIVGCRSPIADRGFCEKKEPLYEQNFYPQGARQSAGCGRENPEQVNIGVTGLGRSVGTTFVATSLAFYFAEKGNCVTYCQCLTPSEADKLLYDAAAMEQRFTCRRFYDIYRMIFEGKPVRGKKEYGKRDQLDFAGPMVLRRKSGLDENQKARLIAGVTGEICIFDFARGKPVG